MPKQVKLWTLQLAKWRIAEKRNLPKLDITVKSGLKYLAPDWDFLMDYKKSDKGPEAEAAYTKRYMQKLNRLFDEDTDKLIEILRQGEVVLMCYCPPGKFCHRHLLVSYLIEIGEWFGYDVIYMGELDAANLKEN
ncbi:DUF488 family protein [Salmonella enterica subsp. enterica serovar Weltevreden]|nr:hypothetical protein [Salmonella enterica subsp. enterica serovar Braenderup]EBX7598149.1 hypothetical protein [Salmonella enterica subsp. enterica serovar Virchow]ECB4558279.1 DUF488 family protein [Salmonella enterica subsp. enterica serovar Weltevreden]